jgi:hypothetical protein
MFIAAIVITAKRWEKNQTTHQLTDKQNTAYIHIMLHCLAIKRNKVLTLPTTWMNF